MWLWKGENLLLPKSVQDIRLPRSPSRLLNKGWASAQEKEAEGGFEGRRWKQGAGKEKEGGGGGYIITFNLEGIRKLFTFVRK